MTHASSKSSQPIETRWAFLVGIDFYEEPNFKPLNFCVNDVKALETLLKQLGYTVVALYDQHPQLHRQPTQRNVEAELTQVCQQIGENDLFFVHFACHGTLVGGQPILAMRDSRKSLLNKPKDRLSVSQVEQMMRESKASRLVLSLDACHTGVEMGRDADDPEFIRNVHDLAEGFVVMAGSTAQQKAQECGSVQHGVYTYYLLRALSGEAARAGNSFASVDDVAKYVLNHLKRWQVENSGLIQEPTVKIEGMGDMILADWRDRPAPTFVVPSPDTQSRSSEPQAREPNDASPSPFGSLSNALSPHQLERKELEKEYANLIAKYESLSEQTEGELNEDNKETLRHRKDVIKRKIDEIWNRLQKK